MKPSFKYTSSKYTSRKFASSIFSAAVLASSFAVLNVYTVLPFSVEAKSEKSQKESQSDSASKKSGSENSNSKKPDSSKSESKKSNSKKAKLHDNDGIDPAVRPLINKGDWQAAIRKLELLTENSSSIGRNEAWLAFCYLYTGNKEKIAALAKRAKESGASEKDKNAEPIVEAFALTVQGKLDDADKALAGLNGGDQGDALLEFARACVALKKGNPALASEYCEKVVGLCPNFAWGFRTLGFIQDKSLKNPQLAERAYEKALAAEPELAQVRGLLIDLKLARNDFDGAVSTAQEAIQLFPREAANYYRLAQIYQQQWRLIEALEQLKKAVSITSDDPRFYRAMASIYRHQGKLDEAIKEQQQAVELSSKDKDFELIELSGLQELDQNPADAIASLQEALKVAPSNTVAHQKLVALLKKEGKKDELVTEFKRAVELQPKVSVLRLQLADAYKQNGKIDEALEELKEAANLDQKDPRPHREVAKIELEKKNYAAAAKSYIRALNINPASVDDLVALGFCYASNNDYMQAETAFTTGLALQQLGASTGMQSSVNQFDIMRSLGSVLFTEGRYREAVVTLEAVVLQDKDGEQKKLDQLMCSEGKALRDRNAESLKELQDSFNALNHQNQLNSLGDYTDTILKLGKKEILVELVKKFNEQELKENCPLVLASAWLAQDRNKEARELINKTIADSKDDSESTASAYLLLAKAMLKDGERTSAVDALKKASEANPKDFDVLVELGKINLADKKLTDALQAAQKALEVNQYCVGGYLLMADTYMAMNKIDDAEFNFKKATELYPTSIEAHKGLLSIFQKQSKTTEAQREQEIISNLSKNS